MNQLLHSSKNKYSISHFSLRMAACFIVILLLTSFSFEVFATTYYVKPDATGMGTGATWLDASGDLQAMIDAAGSGDEVWVAGGTFRPRTNVILADRRFKMKEGVKIYGGFKGTENILADRDLSVTANTSVLLGSRGATTTVFSDNGLSNASLLDGFTIKGSSVGIQNVDSSPSLVNLIITGGTAESAPAVLNRNASPVLTNCAIINNPGIGMTNNASYPILTNCTIAGNIYNGGGYGMQNISSFPKIRNSIIFGNTSGITNEGGSVPVINYSLVQGENNPDLATHNVPGIINPKFEDAAGGNYRLLPCSPAIDKGSNAYYMNDQTPDISNVSKDLADENRFYSDGIVDMGAYEHKGIASKGVAGVWYVRAGATGSGMSWDCPTGDLQLAIDVAANGEQVWVAGGTLRPRTNVRLADTRLKMKEGVQIYGGFKGTENILADRDLSVTANTSVLVGYLGATTTVYSDNNLSNSSLLDGFTIKGSSVGIQNVGSSPSFANLIITGGSAKSAPAVLNQNASPVFTNCAIINNPGTGMANNASYPILTNCTIAGNIYNGGGYGVQNISSFPQIRNSIIFGNTSGINNDANSVPVLTYSLVQGENTPDPATHNVPGIYNPSFKDAAGGDYRLLPCSPAIDKGGNAYYMNDQTPDLSNVSKDLAGENRFYRDGIVDMGAYEHESIASEGVAGVWYVREGATGSGINWDCATGDLQLAINNAANGEQVWVSGGTYQPTNNGTYAMKEGVKIYGGFAGTEKSLAARDLRTASNKSILQANGHAVLINSGLTLTTAAVLDGFTIRGSSNGPGIQNYPGSSPMLSNLIITEHTTEGGMRIFSSSPTLMNCSFTGNYSYTGGGLFIFGGAPKLINCSFTGNSGADGAGLFIVDSSPILVNCLIKGNTATGGGGGMCVTTSTTSLTNCTIVGNTASGQGGGILNRGTSPFTLRNSIVSGNNSGIVNLDAPAITVQYSLVQGQDSPTPSDHNLPGNTNPLFVDVAAGNYRLQPCSPLVNAGFNYFKSGSVPDLSGITSDLDANPRMHESAIDMGAYEFSGASRALAVDGDEAVGVVNGDFLLITNGSGCRVLAYVSPNRTAPLSGDTKAKVWVATDQPTNYLKRHYQIAPAANGRNATAKVTLYFTQQEFTDFNVVSPIKLPVNAADMEGYKANLRIEKRSGISDTPYGLPGSYTGAIETITPSNANGGVAWNADASRWEVSFDVTGFSGFFVKTTQTPLPLNLISFTATHEAGSNLLQWSTTSEINTDHFEVQSSQDAKNFIKIAAVNAAGSGDFQYRYTDRTDYGGTIYYRLKMSDKDGTFTHSKIISATGDENFAAVYPNPAGAMITFQVNDALLKTMANLYDISGRRIQSVIITTNKQQINVKTLASGLYILRFADGTVERFVKE